MHRFILYSCGIMVIFTAIFNEKPLKWFFLEDYGVVDLGLRSESKRDLGLEKVSDHWCRQ